jgi:two-component system cell cycle response regulator DivK
VLIVDDNKKNRKLAGDVLRAAGFRTLEATTAAEGIAVATELLPDVILMDLQLPDMDGADAARRLANATRTARIPVVALTAHRLESDDDWFLAAGFAGYLQKPIDVGGFAEQVRCLCAGPGR